MNQQDWRSGRSCRNIVKTGSVDFYMVVPNTGQRSACLGCVHILPFDNLIVLQENRQPYCRIQE